MASTIPEQVTLIVNKDIAKIMAFFLELHMYEFRRLFDQHQGLDRNPLIPGMPSMKSRVAWLELMAELKGESKSA